MAYKPTRISLFGAKLLCKQASELASREGEASKATSGRHVRLAGGDSLAQLADQADKAALHYQTLSLELCENSAAAG